MSGNILEGVVSTHSRPKAAGAGAGVTGAGLGCFNTQPPEGGWFLSFQLSLVATLFQHTAARRRLAALTQD